MIAPGKYRRLYTHVEVIVDSVNATAEVRER
jgi:hypothetical protein